MATMESYGSTSAPPAFSGKDIALAIGGAALIEAALFALMIIAGGNATKITPVEEKPLQARPISVRPVLDELPLLKLGGKAKPKLPDMWKKQAPVPVKRVQEASAPSPKADKTPKTLPTSALAKPDASAPPPDAEVAKQVDQELIDAAPDAAPTVEGEGSPDGVKEGTETDPLKARAVSQYEARLAAWFSARFNSPGSDEIPCDELKKMSAAASVSVGGGRTVAGFTVTRPSGNAVFDTRVQQTLQGAVGAELPPPPPLYPDILPGAIRPRFVGKDPKCD